MAQNKPPTKQEGPLVILNPAANRGRVVYFRERLRPYIEREQAEYTESSQPGEAETLAYQAAMAGRSIISVGGDGSVHEVVNGLLRASYADSASQTKPNRSMNGMLGIIPAGSGNDFAISTLGISGEPDVAIERAFTGHPTTIDAGMVNGRYFANAFSVGLDADIAAAVGMLKKYPLMSGSRLYSTAILHQLLFGYQHCPWLTLSIDGVPITSQAQRYVLIAVSNGPVYGAGTRINPHADPRDGFLDVCAIDYVSLPRALHLLPLVKKGQHESIPEVHMYRARQVEIKSEISTHMQMDGEVTRGQHWNAEILPGALRVRV